MVIDEMNRWIDKQNWNVHVYTIYIWSWMIQRYLAACGHIKETFWGILEHQAPILLQQLFHIIKYDKNLRLEASIDPESSDDAESLMKKALQELELNIYWLKDSFTF